MFLRILKRDLKRKKTINLILILFIILASMFVSSGLNNVITVISGTNYYLDKAGVGDKTIITTGENSTGHLEKVLKEDRAVSSFRIESVVYGESYNVFLSDGKEAETKNTCIFQSMDNGKLNYYNKDNERISRVKDGHVYVSGNFMNKNNLKSGDKIKIKHNSVELELIFDGKIKDALLGSDFMGNSRFFISERDYQRLTADDTIRKNYLGEIAYINLKDGEELEYNASDIPGVAFDGGRSTIKMCYVMDMIVAFMILILSICLIIVSFAVLRFSINFTIREEFREIGVMKAIGLNNKSIRRLYIGKYAFLAVTGAAIGLLASIPFGAALIKSVSDNMVLGNSMGIAANGAGTVLVILTILTFAYRCTGKVKKLSPIDAIRSGQTGERYRKKALYRIGRSHTSTNLYMALNDVASSPRRFTTIVVAFFVSTLFVLMVVNTSETMESPSLIDNFGAKSDVYVTGISADLNHRVDKDEYEKYLNEQADELMDMGMPAVGHAEVQYKYMITYNGKNYTYSCQQGLNTTMDLYKYTEGKIPTSEREIAITPQVSEKTGAKIGDVITIDFGTEKIDCMVTAYFETMNNLGECIRLHTDAPTDFKHVASIMQTQFTFLDNPSQEEIDGRIDRLKKYFSTEKVMNETEYCMDSTGGTVDILRALKYLLGLITIVVIILVTILMERSFIADEKSQIAILKAIGFKNRDIIKWQVYRFGIIALVAALLAAAVSIPMTKLCITPIFGMMGAREIEYNFVVWKVFGIYPGIVVISTIIVAWITAQYTRTITSRDTASIE